MPMIEHKFQVSNLPRICLKCAQPESRHRKQRPSRPGDRHKDKKRKRSGESLPPIFIGIDGEGKTDTHPQQILYHEYDQHPIATWRHRYTLLAWKDESGTQQDYIEREMGLSTCQCLDFIVNKTPKNCKIFAYFFGYDLSKLLEDLDDYELYRLLRPETRKSEKMKSLRFNSSCPIYWNGSKRPPYKGFALNYLNGQLTISPQTGPVKGQGKKVWFPKGSPKIIYDIGKFFQSKFTVALTDWKVATEERLTKMREMKDKRSEFAKLSNDEIREYCLEECYYMAQLARKLTKAHEEADIPLKQYYGAGSTASAILLKMGIKQLVAQERQIQYPEEFKDAVARAFFGGRFENSVIGPIPAPIYGYDISSAYPYQTTFLPCLLHGEWSKTTKRQDVDNSTIALIRYEIPQINSRITSWAPFPVRFDKTTTVYPAKGNIGWVWKDEYLAGERIFDNVEFREAWVYTNLCDCLPPFREIPEFYRRRVRIGKEGAGIVLKLGPNSVYGKIAQTLGGLGPFTSPIWAGLITSGTRAQLLELMSLHKDISNVLSIATDGIYSLEKIDCPTPRDTDTWELLNEKDEIVKKPLGGWETKVINDGIFFVGPGRFVPLNPSQQTLKEVRARGVGRATMIEQWDKILHAWEHNKKSVVLASRSRFVGMKTAIYKTDNSYKRRPVYGHWMPIDIRLSFDPRPKREWSKNKRDLPLREYTNLVSIPYKKFEYHPTGCTCSEICGFRLQTDIENEQPDADLTQLDFGFEGMTP